MARAEGPRPEVLCRRFVVAGHGREAFESQWHRNKQSSGHRRRGTVPEGAGQGWGPAVSSEGGSGAGGVLTAVPSTGGAVDAAGAGAALEPLCVARFAFQASTVLHLLHCIVM